MLKKRVVSWILMLSGLTLLAACGSEPKPAEVITSHGPGDVVLLIEREGGAGPYVESTAERFKIVASGEVLSAVRWSANAGALEPDAERVTWRLPAAGTASLSVSVETESGKRAEGSFKFNVIASPLASSTAIDTGPNVTGGTCELAFDNAGKGHVVYTNDTHNTLWYASWDGTTWKTEQIDGPGLNNGGVFTAKPVLAIDPVSGTPHVGYIKGTGAISYVTRVGYATRVNGVWVREEVYTAATTRMGIALNPTQGQQPVIVFGDNSPGSIRVATRTPANTGATVLLPLSTTHQLTSDPVFDATGALYFITYQVANNNANNYLRVLRNSVVESVRLADTPSASVRWLAMVWGPDQHLFALSNWIWEGERTAIDDITVGTPLSSTTQNPSPVDYKYASSDLAYGAGKPVVAMRNGTTLELSTTDAQGFWTYTQLGTVQDGTRPSVAVRPTDGVPHVCYQRDGKVSFQ